MNSSDYIATASVIIALLALIVTFFQLRSAKKHNILSVRPLIRMNIERGDSLIYSFENNGLGPGMVAQVVFTIEGTRLENPDHIEFQKCISLICDDKLSVFEYEYHLPAIQTAYKPYEKIELLKIQGVSEKDNDDLYELLEAKIEIQLFYYSLYQEELFGCGTIEKMIKIK